MPATSNDQPNTTVRQYDSHPGPVRLASWTLLQLRTGLLFSCYYLACLSADLALHVVEPRVTARNKNPAQFSTNTLHKHLTRQLDQWE